jgi:hypothetical protein
MRDTAAIKKAYAAKLRITRPDQDAAAYQELREAFDAALAYAKSTPQPAMQQPSWQDIVDQALELHAADPPAPAAAAQAQWQDEPAPAAACDLGDLLNTALDLWEEQGDAALIAHWPRLEQVLGAMSLTQTLAASTACARMVLREPKLPPEFVEQLRLFFGWGSDYRRMPQLVGHDSVAFKRRLAQLVHELDSKKLREEQERINAVKASARELDAAAQLLAATRSRFGRLLPFARMMATAGSRAAIRNAILMGPILQRQWSGMSASERTLLEIDDRTFRNGIDTFALAMRLRARFALGVLEIAVLFQVLAGQLTIYSVAVIAALAACHWYPVYHMQESARARLYPAAFIATWIRTEFLDRKEARVFAIVVSLLGLMFCMVAAPPLIGEGVRYSTGAAVAAIVLLACQWLYPPDGVDQSPDAIIPILLLCLVTCHSIGITDGLTQLSLSVFWMAIAYSALSKWWGWLVGTCWALAVVLIYFHWQYLGREPTLVPLSLIVPWLLFHLARTEGAGFVMFAIALGVLLQPFASSSPVGIWVGAVATAAGWASLLARQRVT